MNAPDPLNVKPYDDAPEVPKMLEEVGFNQPLTLRDSKVNNSIQDMSWEEHAFPVIDRYLSSLASAIDGEFRAAFSDASYEGMQCGGDGDDVQLNRHKQMKILIEHLDYYVSGHSASLMMSMITM